MYLSGNPSAGLVLLNKKLRITSQKAILEVKRKLQLDKIGHCGTLDPLATGLLVCLTGRATRLASYVEKNDKIYSGTIQLGLKTTTDDLEGEIISESKNFPSFEEISLVVKNKFTGLISQIPPSYSALKVDGQRAYKLARSGQAVELAARQVEIKNFEIKLIAENILEFQIKCTVGTYIRSIARELGDILGCGGTIASLHREASLPFYNQEAEQIENLESKHILSWTLLFPDAIFIPVSEHLATKLLNGLPSAILELVEGQGNSNKPIIYEFNAEPLGLIVNNANKWEFAFKARA